MKTILQQLYEGSLRPDLLTPESDEYEESRNAYRKNRDALLACMPELETKITPILDNYSFMNVLEREEMFQYGFSLGVRLVTEALSIQ